MSSQSIDDFQDPFDRMNMYFLMLSTHTRRSLYSIWPLETPLYGPDKPIDSGTAHFHLRQA